MADEPQTAPKDVPSAPHDSTDATETPLVEEDLLVEDISIDGMCGVY